MRQGRSQWPFRYNGLCVCVELVAHMLQRYPSADWRSRERKRHHARIGRCVEKLVTPQASTTCVERLVMLSVMKLRFNDAAVVLSLIR